MLSVRLRIKPMSMLAAFIQVHYARFTTLAEAWLANGATTFGIWQKGQLLAGWPAGNKPDQPGLVMPICVGDQVIGDVRISGMPGSAARARLAADVELIAHLFRLEHEIECMASDLVVTQDQLVALYRLSHSMSQYLTIEETLTALVMESMRLIKARNGFAMFVPSIADPIVVQHPPAEIDEALLWRCFWQAHSAAPEVSLTTLDLSTTMADCPRDLLFIPIKTRDTVIAGLGMLRDPGRGFQTPDIKLARAIANQASAQIEKVLLYKETFDQAKIRAEMELARQVQQDLLPKQLPHVTGLDIFAASRPAFQVGGDFYDFICQTDRPFTFSIGDVSGKGFPAALLMTMTRMAIHSKAFFMPEPTPRVVLQQSNKDLYKDFTQVGVFATAFVGQYHPQHQMLHYANAGHSPVIYRPAAGAATMLMADSTAIGIFPVSSCEDQEVALRPGDLLIVATDGFSDARNPDDEMFGHKRLLDLVDTLAEQSAQDIADSLFTAGDRFKADCPQEDDQTLVVIKGVAT